MSNSVTPFLMFKSRGKEAIEFYCEVFKDSEILALSTMPGSDQLVHGKFRLNKQVLFALDGGDHDGFVFTEGISLFVECEDQAEVDYYWKALQADGGSPSQCGWLKDRFGVSWQVIPKQLGQLMQDPQVAGQVVQAMLKMSKIIVADLEAAAAG